MPRGKNVLIYRLGSLGDTVVALPCFHRIRQVYRDARITLLTNRPVASKAAPIEAILGRDAFFDEVLDYPVGTRSPRVLLGLASEIRTRRIDTVVSLVAWRGKVAAIRDRLFFRAGGVDSFVGFPRSSDGSVELDPATGLYEWEAKRLAGRLAAIGEPDLQDSANWDLRLSADELAEGQSQTAPLAGAPFLVMGMGTKMPAKDWEEPNWSALVERLAGKLPGWSLLLVGAAEERDRSARCAEVWKGRVVNLCGAVSPRVCAAAMRGAAAFIGPDSGPMHLAACMGVPCVAIFAARNLPGHWYPRGSHNRVIYHQTECYGCNLEVCITERKRCILSISVDEVETATLGLLQLKRPLSR